ncbi:MAG: EF-P lysine aminoacylase EpmA [Planctomycetota bacterium]
MDVADILQQREQTIDAIRRFFKTAGFVEVETPLLVRSPGLEPHLDPFEVRAQPPLFLATSPEYGMKKLVGAGSGSIFQVGKAFRDEPPGPGHLPEFTLLEWYRAGADYRAVMDDCERLLAHVAGAVCGDTTIAWQGRELDLAPPAERISVRDAFRRDARLSLRFDEPLDRLRALAESAGSTDLADDDTWDDVFFKLFLRFVEPRLGRDRPTILYDYPARMAALSRVKEEDPLLCERFELYAGGLELANAFGELTDPAEQRRRFEADNAERRRIGKPELPIDDDLLDALGRMPPCSGIALGMDRLVMLLTDTPDVRDVVPLLPG